MRIQVPTTMKDVRAQLGGLDDLITAKQWARAAIVFAFTYDGRGGKPKNADKRALSVAQFSALGVHGLTNSHTVAAYRDAWKTAIAEHDAPDVKPGDRVTLPGVEWPGRQDESGQKRYIEKDPAKLAKAVAADPAALAALPAAAIAKAVAAVPDAARAIARNEEAREAVEEAGIEHHARHTPEPEDPKKAGRQAARNVGRAAGVEEAIEDLKSAARLIASASVWRDEYGVEDHAGEHAALLLVKRWLTVYETAPQTLTETDHAFLAENGIVA